MRTVRLALVAATAATAAFALPSSAATSHKLYFGNSGTCGAASPAYSLTDVPTGSGCASPKAAVLNTGLEGHDTYDTTGPGTTGYVIDVSRKLTGTVYVANYAPVTDATGPAWRNCLGRSAPPSRSRSTV